MLKPLKKATLAISIAASLALLPSAPAQAVPNTLDSTPAATLLFPYFEVNLGDTNGMTTLFAIQNVWATAMLVNVTIWSDRGIPVYNFPVYLTGYDVQSINLRDVLNGSLPQTASDGQDPSDNSSPTTGISNQGQYSQDINFASCNGILPLAALDGATQTGIRNALTGQATTLFAGQCAGTNYGDNVARGYITADTVNSCGGGTPDTANYFTNNTTTQNALSGDWFLVDQSQNFMQTDAAVAIEAVYPTIADLYTAGNPSFYGHLVGWDGSDDREALPATWVVQAQNDLGTLHVWRDTKRTPAAASCGVQPTDLALEKSLMFGMDTDPYNPAAVASPLPVAAQRTDFDQTNFGLPAIKTGFHYLSLNHNNGDVAGLTDPLAAQSHVTVIRHSQGRFSTGAAAMPMDSGAAPTHTHPTYNP